MKYVADRFISFFKSMETNLKYVTHTHTRIHKCLVRNFACVSISKSCY
jgi:hypothetical protein